MQYFNNAAGRHLIRNLDIYLILLILFSYGASIAIFNHFYGVMGINRYQSYFYVIFLQLGFLSALATEKYIRSIIISIGLAASLVVMLIPFFLILVFPGIIGSVIAGSYIGRAVKSKYNISRYKIIAGTFFILFILNFIIMGSIAIRLDNCDYFANDEKDACYDNKAYRYRDENICAKIKSQYDKKMCYESVIFDYEEENYVNATQCDGILNETDREYCYVDFAEEKVNKSICDDLVKNENIRVECYEEVNQSRCHKMPWGKKRSDCEDELKRRDAEKISHSDVQNSELQNREISEYERYQEILQEEVTNGDTTHVRSQRFSQVSTIKKSVKNALQYTKECDGNGGIIKGTENGLGFICPGYSPMSWPFIGGDSCGKVQSDAKWIVDYNDGEWSYTLDCKNYPECSGMENLRCTKNGCVFSEKCNETL